MKDENFPKHSSFLEAPTEFARPDLPSLEDSTLTYITGNYTVVEIVLRNSFSSVLTKVLAHFDHL
jgi:hypothetical protein